jgi:tetratricopeptide (TPR) repeat protein/transglutaminase-like putative cysteine protease
VVGPFDNEGKAGCNTAYGPEKELDLAAKYQGKVREIGWRKVPEISRDGFVDLDAMLSPANETVAYALAVVEAAQDEKAVLHLGHSGAARLFVNGTKVYSDDRYHPPRFDQAAVQVSLKKGANRVLLKVCQETGSFGFWLRASGANGDAMGSLTNPLLEALPPAPKGAVAFEVLPGLVDHFKKRAEAAKGDAKARAEYAEVLFHKQAYDVKDRRDAAEAAQAAKAAPSDASIQLLASNTAEDSNERRRFLDAALAAQPGHPGASYQLARHQLNQDYPRRALSTVQAALAKNPSWFPLALLEARALDEAGLAHESAQRIEALQRSWADRPEVVREAARLARRREKAADAAALYRVALALRYDDLESRRALSSLLVEKGDVEGALKEMQEGMALEPWNVSAWLRIAELAAANGRPELAQQGFARAEEIAPEDAEVYERKGRALSFSGDKAAALAAFERALSLKPQNPSLKEALKALRGEGKGFGEDLAYDAPKLASSTPPVPGEDSTVLGDLTAVKVLPSGLAQRFEHAVIRVQTARGVESERSQWITFSPDRQELKILKARVLKADGSVIETHTEQERSLSDTETRLYYDARGRVIGFPNLAPGDVIEMAWRLDDTANDNLLSDYFGDVQSLQGESIKARFDYYLLAPPGRTIYSSQPTLPLEKTEQAQADGSRLYHWSGKALPKIVPEPGMPGRSEVSPPLHVSTYKDWDSVGRYYWGLVRDQLTVTDEIRATLKELTARLPPKDERAIIRAVYDFVVSRTRYVGLEFGIHGYKPYKVTQVLSRRFGDCKDKASLIHALLEAAGIDSRLVLLRMRRLGAIGAEPASLSIFDHAIAYVPKYDLWLDGTAEHYGSRELPVEDRGATVLVIEPGGGSKLGQIPFGKPEDNLTRSEYEVALTAAGAATVAGKTTISGLAAPEYRRTYQQPATRKQSYEQGWARAFPGLSVKQLEFSDLTDIEREVELRYSLDVPRYASADDGGERSFSAFGSGASYVESFAPLSARKHDLELPYPWANRARYRFSLPAGWAAKALPSDVELKSPFGALTLKYRAEGGALTLETDLVMAVSRVKAAEYPAYRAFLGQVDQALQRRVKLAPAAAAPKAAAAP